MKKLFKLFAFAAIFGALSVSCSKEAAAPDEEVTPGADGTEVTAPADDENLPEGMVRLTFAVSAENEADPELKTSWNGTTHSWANGDKVRILWGTGDSDYYDAEVKSGGVSAVVSETAETFYAVYPTTATYALDLTEGKVTITIPRYQSGKFEDANIMAAKTSKTARRLDFKNMTSILKFTTGNTYSYNSASFMVNDKSVKLTGEVHTTFPNDFDVTTTNDVMKQDIVCIQPDKPEGNAGMAANTTYYLAMLPGAAIANGIGFKIEQRGEHTDLLGGGLSKASFNRERSKVYNLGTLDGLIVKDWYISESGSGKGNIESDPAGPEKLMDLLNPSYSGQNTTAGWRLTNATIHVAGGTYNLQALNGGEVFDPHYNLSGLVAYIKGEGTAANPTKFVCNEADGDHIFALTGTNRVGNFKFENITFTATNSFASDGVAFKLTSTGKTDDEHNVITFKNCTFSGLNSTVSSGSGYGGGAVNIYDNADFDVIFDGCMFKNNTAVRGGAVALTNGGENSKVSFTGCTFSNNVASSNQGGAVYVYAKGKTTFDSTSFTGDGSTNQAANGGALAVMADATVTIQNNSSFTNCVTTGGGGAIFNHGTVIFDNSSASGCIAKNGGAIYSDSSVEIRNGSTFTANDATSNGGCIWNSKNLTIDASTISGKGKDTDMTALLGGGLYNSNTGIASLSNGTVIENCAITGNSHYGAAIWNSGKLNVDGCSLRNNKNTQRGAAIYGVNTACVINLTNTVISGNDAANGAGLHLDDGAYACLNACTISENSATNGSALRTANSTDNKDISKVLVFNSLIEKNISGSSTSTQNNSTVQATGYSTFVIANCTLRKNTTPGSTSVLTVNGANSKLYAVSCTMAENDADLRRTNAVLEVHNSILMGLADNPLNVIIEKSFWYGHLYGTDRNDRTDNVSFSLGDYDSQKGVYRLNNVYSTIYTKGMSANELKALTFNNITLTDEQKLLLAKDQKGNPRNGTIMGAYAPTE